MRSVFKNLWLALSKAQSILVTFCFNLFFLLEFSWHISNFLVHYYSLYFSSFFFFLNKIVKCLFNNSFNLECCVMVYIFWLFGFSVLPSTFFYGYGVWGEHNLHGVSKDFYFMFLFLFLPDLQFPFPSLPHFQGKFTPSLYIWFPLRSNASLRHLQVSLSF